MKELYLCLILLAFSSLHAQNKLNVSCMDFTFGGKKNVQGNSLKKIYEEELANSNLIWNVVERDRMDIFFQKLQEEKNLYKDFNNVLKNPELAGVDYLIIGDIDLNLTLDKYKVNISFIKLTGESITTKFPTQVSFTRTEFLDEDTVRAYFRSSIKDFTESHFILNGTDWIKAPNFYNELDKRDSVINFLEKENQIQKIELSKVNARTIKIDSAENARHKADLDLEALKQKPPSIDTRLVLDKNGKMYLNIKFLNEVPIKVDYWITPFNENTLLSGFLLEHPTIYPPKGMITSVSIGSIGSWNIAKDQDSKITLHLTYESIYFEENRRPGLKNGITQNYVLDPKKLVINLDSP